MISISLPGICQLRAVPLRSNTDSGPFLICVCCKGFQCSFCILRSNRGLHTLDLRWNRVHRSKPHEAQLAYRLSNDINALGTVRQGIRTWMNQPTGAGVVVTRPPSCAARDTVKLVRQVRLSIYRAHCPTISCSMAVVQHLPWTFSRCRTGDMSCPGGLTAAAVAIPLFSSRRPPIQAQTSVFTIN